MWPKVNAFSVRLPSAHSEPKATWEIQTDLGIVSALQDDRHSHVRGRRKIQTTIILEG